MSTKRTTLAIENTNVFNDKFQWGKIIQAINNSIINIKLRKAEATFWDSRLPKPLPIEHIENPSIL